MATSFEARPEPRFEPRFEPLFPAPANAAAPSGPAWLTALSARSGFAEDLQFGSPTAVASLEQQAADDALARAFAEGVAQGKALAQEDFAGQGQAHGALTLSMAQLDEAMQQQLAQRLAETVAALCEAALAPLALDREALERRCVRAAGMVGDGIIDASLRLHPDDIALLDRDFASTWHIAPDPALERGTVVFDMVEGAVVDGPGEWHAALREALGLC